MAGLQDLEFENVGEEGRQMSQSLGYSVEQSSHYLMRNADPAGLPNHLAVLHPLSVDGLNQLISLWRQEGGNHEAKMFREGHYTDLREEVTFWTAFRGGPAAELLGMQAPSLDGGLHRPGPIHGTTRNSEIAVLDVGVCYSAKYPDNCQTPHDVTMMSLLDYLNLSYERSMVDNATELDEVGRMFSENGLPSAGGSPMRSGLSKRLFVGSSGQISPIHRLVVKKDSAWLADLHESVEFRRASMCRHKYKITTFSDDEGSHFLPDEIRQANRVVWLMRGMRCSETTFENHQTCFASVKNMWLSVRVMKNLHDRLEARILADEAAMFLGEMPAGFSTTSPSFVSTMLQCGVQARRVLYVCSSRIMRQSKLQVSTLEDMLRHDQDDSDRDKSLFACFEACNSLEALDLVLWLHTLSCARTCLQLEHYAGILPIDPSTPFLFGHEEDAVDFGDDDVDDKMGHLLELAVNVTSSENLRSFEYVSPAPPPEAAVLAGSLTRLTRLAVGVSDGNGLVFGGETWLLPTQIQKKVTLKDTNGDRKVFEIAGSSLYPTIISYWDTIPVKAKRNVARWMRKVKGFRLGGSGADFESRKPKLPEDLRRYVQMHNCFDQLISGDFGDEGLIYALNLVFRGGLKIGEAPDLPTSYIPAYAKRVDGLLLTSFVNPGIMSRATYIYRDGQVLWLPGHGLNAFAVKHDVRKKVTCMREITETINVTEKCGATTISFPIG